MTPEELIERFKSDIIYDCHSYGARFRRSDGRKELERRGSSVLPQIIKHLENKPPGDFMDLKTAWGNLLSNFARNIGMEEVNPAPDLLKDTQGWVEWAARALTLNQQWVET